MINIKIETENDVPIKLVDDFNLTFFRTGFVNFQSSFNEYQFGRKFCFGTFLERLLVKTVGFNRLFITLQKIKLK